MAKSGRNKYKSKWENFIASLFRKHKVKFKYEPIKLAYVIESNYEPDFVLPNGVIIEAKGNFKPADRRKMIAVKKAHPDLDIRMWFMRDNYLNNKTKASRYSDWCKKNNFPYHIGEKLPKEWVK